MDASLFSKIQAGHVAAAHAVGTSLAPKIGATSNLRTPAGAPAAARARAATPEAAATGGSGTSTSTPATDGSTITSDDFLTLLVSELKNQDPTQPTDPNQYITQLTEVNSLEQLISINSGISSLDASVAPSKSSGTGSGSGTGSVVLSPAAQGTVQTPRATAGTKLA